MADELLAIDTPPARTRRRNPMHTTRQAEFAAKTIGRGRWITGQGPGFATQRRAQEQARFWIVQVRRVAPELATGMRTWPDDELELWQWAIGPKETDA